MPLLYINKLLRSWNINLANKKIIKLRVTAFLITRYSRARRTKIRLRSMNHVDAKFRRNAKALRPKVRGEKKKKKREK